MTNIAPLAAALVNIADITSDPIMAGRALYHDGQLRAQPSEELEHSVKSIRDELDGYKSDYRDSFDQSEKMQVALSKAYEIARQGGASFSANDLAAEPPQWFGKEGPRASYN